MKFSKKPMTINDVIKLRYKSIVQEINEKLYYYFIPALKCAEIPKLKLGSVYRNDWLYFYQRIKDDYEKLGWLIEDTRDFIIIKKVD